jgi:hypothetical protein
VLGHEHDQADSSSHPHSQEQQPLQQGLG